jgi:hypothetical protein
MDSEKKCWRCKGTGTTMWTDIDTGEKKEMPCVCQEKPSDPIRAAADKIFNATHGTKWSDLTGKKRFTFIESAIRDAVKRVLQDILDEHDKLKAQRNIDNKTTHLACLLNYIRIRQGGE